MRNLIEKKFMKRCLVLVLILTTFTTFAAAQAPVRSSGNLPVGYWSIEKTQPILEKTQTIRLAPDLGSLSTGERRAMEKLNQVGAIFQDLYELQRYPHSVNARKSLESLNKQNGSNTAAQNLLTLYRLNQGPVATTLDSKREPFLPYKQISAGGMYPADSTKEELDAFLAANPDKRDSILGSRTVVRRSTASNLKRDLDKLRQYPVLDTLHPGLKRELQTAITDAKSFYAVPYSIAYADEMIRAHALLNEAAGCVERDDAEFAGYLRNRSRDLLSDDYESAMRRG
jgi:hypothetical protein